MPLPAKPSHCGGQPKAAHLRVLFVYFPRPFLFDLPTPCDCRVGMPLGFSGGADKAVQYFLFSSPPLGIFPTCKGRKEGSVAGIRGDSAIPVQNFSESIF